MPRCPKASHASSPCFHHRPSSWMTILSIEKVMASLNPIYPISSTHTVPYIKRESLQLGTDTECSSTVLTTQPHLPTLISKRSLPTLPLFSSTLDQANLPLRTFFTQEERQATTYARSDAVLQAVCITCSFNAWYTLSGGFRLVVSYWDEEKAQMPTCWWRLFIHWRWPCTNSWVYLLCWFIEMAATEKCFLFRQTSFIKGAHQ